MATKADAKHDLERGERIEDLMRLQGWSPSDLSRAIHVDRSQIYKWLAGRPISSDNVGKLAVALGTTRRYIVSGDGPKWTDDARVLERLELLETRVIGALDALRADLAGGDEVTKRSRRARRQAARPEERVTLSWHNHQGCVRGRARKSSPPEGTSPDFARRC